MKYTLCYVDENNTASFCETNDVPCSYGNISAVMLFCLFALRHPYQLPVSIFPVLKIHTAGCRFHILVPYALLRILCRYAFIFSACMYSDSETLGVKLDLSKYFDSVPISYIDNVFDYSCF